MPPSPLAARVGDKTGHPGVIGSPSGMVPTVWIGGQPAATVGMPHICWFPSPPVHPPSTIEGPGSATVLICGQRAARVGDLSGCQSPITTGCDTVLIGG